MSRHRSLLRWLSAAALFFSAVVHAECGGQQQCIAISIDPAVAPAHGTPETSAPLAFGSQGLENESLPRVVLVGAVTGPPGSLATLSRLDIEGPHAGDFRVVNQTCTVGSASLLADGPTCSFGVAFRPTGLGFRTAEVLVSTSSITRRVPMNGTGVLPLPTASSTSMTVPNGGFNTVNLATLIGPANQVLTVEITTVPQRGSVVLGGSVATYQAPAGFSGTETFEYVARGASGASSPAKVTVSVLEQSSGPFALASEFSVRGMTPATLDLSGKFGPAGEALTLAISRAPQRGSASISGTEVTYQPTVDFVGTDTFAYTVSSKTGGTSAPATVTVQRLAPLAVPTAAAVTMSAKAAIPTTLDLANFIGPPGEALSLAITIPPQKGTAVLSGTRVIYTSVGGYVGPDSFVYIVSGPGGAAPPATVSVSVVARSDPSADPVVKSSLRAQVQTAQRFARAQLANVQTRLGALRRLPERARQAAPALSLGAPGLGHVAQSDAGVLLASRVPDDGSDQLGHQDPSMSGASVAPLWLITLAQAAHTGSLKLDAAERASDGSRRTTGFWIGGLTQFGSRQDRDASLRFRSDGVTLGVDRRFSSALIAGVSGGYAKDRTELGDDGSGTRSVGNSVSLYASYQPGDRLFVEGLVGVGRLDLDINRFIAAEAITARGVREGRQWFGSIALGYQMPAGTALLSPYGRIDAARTRLSAYTETGVGQAALSFQDQSLPSAQLALGMSAQSRHSADFGWVLPRIRLEWRQELRREGLAKMSYADLPDVVYPVPPSNERSGAWVLGVGSDFLLWRGLKVGADFQTSRQRGVDQKEQAVRLWLTKELDGTPVASPSTLGEEWFTDPLRIEATWRADRNLNRAAEPTQERSDHAYSMGVSKGTEFRLARNFRLVATAFGSADKFSRYAELDRVSLGGVAAVEYRGSSAFTEPIIGLQSRLSLDSFSDELRSGRRHSVLLTYRRSITDRIEVFSHLGSHSRHADSVAFDIKDRSALVQIDYAITPTSMAYLTAERRHGGVVSTVPTAPAYASFAQSSSTDGGYGAPGLTAYRYDAKTLIWTLGYNLPLGPRDGLDFAIRRAASTPTAPPSPLYGQPPKYTSTQLSVAYLTRF